MIQIKNPCDASWKEMTPADSGKYCGTCEKVVVDFSNMNDVQIKEYFAEYATQKTCGRFLASQIDRPFQVTTPVISSNFWKKINRVSVFRSVMLLWASSVLWLTNCVNKNTPDEITTGDSVSIPVELDTIVEVDSAIHTVDNVAPTFKDKASLPDEVMGEVSAPQTIKCLPQEVIMGDFMIPPTDEPDTVTLNIPAVWPETNDTIIRVIQGKVMMVDTISQKIKRKKK